MPAWVWITPLAGVAFVFWIGWGRGWLRAWRYDWLRAQHVRARAREVVQAASVFYGSMGLTDEQVLHHELPWLPAPTVDPAPWLEQTRAELSPEALGDDDEPLSPPPLSHPVWRNPKVTPADLPEVVLPDAGGWISGPCLDDPGPGDAAVEPPASSGPDHCEDCGAPTDEGHHLEPSEWLTEQLAVVRRWAEWHQQKAVILA